MSETVRRPRRWRVSDIPSQRGRTALITGANTGLGFAVANLLARHGAQVILACRNQEKAAAARDRILAGTPDATVRLLDLDLTSLASVRQAAQTIHADVAALDLLINNAGVMWTPYQRTAEGFELQFGTNHLGHFAFTGLLLDRLRDTAGSRIVTVSSLLHRMGRIDFDSLHGEGGYHRYRAYGQSKLANILFTNELQHRLAATGCATIAVAVHPGVAATELVRNSPSVLANLASAFGSLVMPSPATGALSVVRAATDLHARGGDFYGPQAMLWGPPSVARPAAHATDIDVQRRLWTVSEQLTGVSYQLAVNEGSEA